MDDNKNEVWEFGRERWIRDLKSGRFSLRDYQDRAVNFADVDAEEVAALCAARRLQTIDEQVTYLPESFHFSPSDGARLAASESRVCPPWACPFGASVSAGRKHPGGLRLSADPLRLRAGLVATGDPDRVIPMPPPGRHEFMVGKFGCKASRLLAIDNQRGQLFCFRETSQRWQELKPQNSSASLPVSQLAPGAWAPFAQDLDASPSFLVPTDYGIAKVTVNLVAGTYELRTASAEKCVASPAAWQGDIYCLGMLSTNQLGVIAVTAAEGEQWRVVARYPITGAVGEAEWGLPVVDSRRLIWSSAAGQIVVHRDDGSAVEAELVAWPSGFAPQFRFGAPHHAVDGNLWQLCYQHDEGYYAYIALGTDFPDVHRTSSARFGTGMSTFKLETQLKANPWLDLEHGMHASEDDVILPLLESFSSGYLIAVSTQSTQALDVVLDDPDKVFCKFEWHGPRGRSAFYSAKIARPWETRVFGYDGHLFLSHSELNGILGWRSTT